jgi:hypothetical protein
MTKNNLTLLLLFVFYIASASSQSTENYRLFLQNEALITTENINHQFVSYFNTHSKKAWGKFYCILQFEKIPLSKQIQDLNSEGIQLLEYIPEKAYVVSVSRPLQEITLRKTGVRSIIDIFPHYKVSNALKQATTNNNALIDVWVSMYDDCNIDSCAALLKQIGCEITSMSYWDYNLFPIRVTKSRIEQLTQMAFVKYIDLKPEEPTNLLNGSTTLGRANILHSSLPTGYNLSGSGITIVVNELMGPPASHPDYNDRLTTGMNGSDAHSSHVTGITGGAGNINELYRGFAPKSKLYTDASYDVLRMTQLFRNYGAVISNNSYGSGILCNSGSYFNLWSAIDQISIVTPQVLNVFAAGNSGTFNCNNGFPIGYATLADGYAGAKNAISVGGIRKDYSLSPFSSRGPAGAGRIKPELMAVASSVVSTFPNNNYGQNFGTSMAAPAVAGGAALLYERYKQLNNNHNPQAGLIKAILCNTATDIGNKGPDFTYGFGAINLLRAVRSIDAKTYFHDSLSHTGKKSYSITVTEKVAKLKIMLYWNDRPNSPYSGRTLVNDFDINVSAPSGNTYLPLVLDTSRLNVANLAVIGEDHINNIEQVVIENPVAGNYMININAREIAIGNMEPYFVCYDIIKDTIELTFPVGGETLLPGESLPIEWDSWGQDLSAFDLFFSADNGGSWQIISQSINAGTNRFNWALPVINTSGAMVKLIRKTDGKESISSTFTILGTPVVSLSSTQCPGFISLHWNPVTAASYYEIFMMQDGEMKKVDTTSALNYIFKNLNETKTYWVSVAAVLNDKRGRRSIAVSRKPADGDCNGFTPAYDLKAEALTLPVSTRQFTTAYVNGSQPLSFVIKNLRNIASGSYTINYNINNTGWVSETSGISIAPLASIVYTTAGVFNFSIPGVYKIIIAVKSVEADINTQNDTLYTEIKTIANPVLNVNNGHIETFEKADPTSYVNSYFGLKGIEQFDYNQVSAGSSVSFVSNNTFPYISDSSGRSIQFFGNTSQANNEEFIGTFNLSAYDTSAWNIGFSFNLYRSPIQLQANDLIFVRGKDTDPWIEAGPLTGIPGNIVSTFAFTGRLIAVKTGDLLKKNRQNYSSSFQIKLSKKTSSIYIIDDYSLWNIKDDVELISIDNLPQKSCGLSSSTPISITVKNNNPIPVSAFSINYRINNGAVHTETPGILLADTMIQFTFSKTADLSSTGFHTIEVWVDYPGDTYLSNNKLQYIVRNQPVIKQLPFLENFENGMQGWYAEGINSSWEFGQPASSFIADASSGNYAWKTKLNGVYNANERSYVYSPCFEISNMQDPIVALSYASQMERGVTTFLDFMSIQYSTNGYMWTNFTVPEFSLGSDPTPNQWRAANSLSKQLVPVNNKQVQFRLSLRTNNIEQFDGFAFDDFHIYDNIYSILDTVPGVYEAPANFNNSQEWKNITLNGRITASILPLTTYNGSIQLTTYIEKNITPDFHGQYYLKRHYQMKGGSNKDSFLVRLYFTVAEVEALKFAYSCPGCIKPKHAYRLGISSYSSDSTKEENNRIDDNTEGAWRFSDYRQIKFVPYEKGYYVEFKTSGHGEYWINNGGLNNKSFLPVSFTKLTADKTGNNSVQLRFSTASQVNIRNFEIEVARGNDAYKNKQFEKISTINNVNRSATESSYTYNDINIPKLGAQYYRIKTLDSSGNYTYSKTTVAITGNEFKWKILPNPYTGNQFKLQYQLNTGEGVFIQVYNISGMLIHTQALVGTGFIQQTDIRINPVSAASGVYVVKVITANETIVLKAIKN